MSSISLLKYVKISSNDKGLEKVQLPLILSQEFREGVWGNFKYGCVYRVQTMLSLWYHWIIITDFELSRYVLSSQEAEKPWTNRILNFLDRKTYNVFSHLTSDTSREKARKVLATAFSTSFLNKSFIIVEDCVLRSLKTIRDVSATGTANNAKHIILEMMLTMLGKSAFGIDISFDCSETDSTINGNELLKLFEVLTRQRSKEIVNPFKAYFFWDKDIQQMNYASKRLTEVSSHNITVEDFYSSLSFHIYCKL